MVIFVVGIDVVWMMHLYVLVLFARWKRHVDIIYICKRAFYVPMTVSVVWTSVCVFLVTSWYIDSDATVITICFSKLEVYKYNILYIYISIHSGIYIYVYIVCFDVWRLWSGCSTKAEPTTWLVSVWGHCRALAGSDHQQPELLPVPRPFRCGALTSRVGRRKKKPACESPGGVSGACVCVFKWMFSECSDLAYIIEMWKRPFNISSCTINSLENASWDHTWAKRSPWQKTSRTHEFYWSCFFWRAWCLQFSRLRWWRSPWLLFLGRSSQSFP